MSSNGISDVMMNNTIETSASPSCPISAADITNTFTGNTISNSLYGLFMGNFIHTGESPDSFAPSSPISAADITNIFTGNTISGNSAYGVFMGNGNEIYTNGSDSPISTADITNTFTGNSISGNGTGVYMPNAIVTTSSNSPISTADISDTFTGNSISGNSGGVSISYGSGWNYVSTVTTKLLMQENKIIANGGVGGVFVDFNSFQGTFTGDLGGGSLGSAGNNSFYGNTGGDLKFNNTGTTISAEHNWWGQPGGPVSGQVITSGTGTNVDSANPLPVAP